jgi:phosphotriesterase-related protein
MNFKFLRREAVPQLITTAGPISSDQLGLILPHEHVFVDLRTPDQPGYAEAETEDVLNLMVPEIQAAQAAGITALVECSTTGVGRRVDILKAVSAATHFPLVVPTGTYREPWIPKWIHDAMEDDLYQWMLAELTGEIEETGVQAGFVKLSAGDDGLTQTEIKVLRAAGRAAKEVNAAIGSHTIRGSVVHDQLDILESVGYPLDRFIWIHAHIESDFALNLEMAGRGAWIEYDGIGWDNNDEITIQRLAMMIEAGYSDRLMISMDRGWYDPAQPGGGEPKPYTYLVEEFLPKAQAAGIDPVILHQITHTNPFRAFAR